MPRLKLDNQDIIFLVVMNPLGSAAIIVILEMGLSLIGMVANLVICISIRYRNVFISEKG